MLHNQTTDIKIGDYLVKNVPVHTYLPFENVIVYMNNRSLKEIEYKEWIENEMLFQEYKMRVNEIKRATEKLSEMGFNKQSITGLLERFYDNHEKGKALAKEIEELK
ncbi:hypothetical protein [Cytobacillus firmus]|uniref:hypothetical protein n=1 Tax=Cytobacillus firmus TaxID=1399 RepID=UPI0018CD22F2|nr:hypothetical protein [Cytobacillus firmus]MBG9657083.1 hypothetical protein [Cytobacillus firmus]MED1906755.1 hypothetical protein [Cytobacillus firmus]